MKYILIKYFSTFNIYNFNKNTYKIQLKWHKTSVKEGVQRDDLEILKKLKKAKKKMVLAVNKCDKLRRNKSRFL